MTLPFISDVIIKYYSQIAPIFSIWKNVCAVTDLQMYSEGAQGDLIYSSVHLLFSSLSWDKKINKKKITDEIANRSTVNLDPTFWARSCTKVNDVSDYRVSSQWWMGEGPASGIMRKTPCGSWYMEHDHPWLIHVPRVTRPSLFSIGFMTSRGCNLSSCIMAMVSWHIFFFFVIIIILEILYIYIRKICISASGEFHWRLALCLKS